MRVPSVHVPGPRDHMLRQRVRLLLYRRVAAGGPAINEVLQERQRRIEATLVDHRKEPMAWPQDQSGAAISALISGALVAGCFAEMLVVRFKIVERQRGREFAFQNGNFGQR